MDFSDCSIDNLKFIKIQQCLVSSQCTITSLNLSHNKMSLGAGVNLAVLISFCRIKKLTISHNDLSVTQLSHAFAAVHCQQNITRQQMTIEMIDHESLGWIFFGTVRLTP